MKKVNVLTCGCFLLIITLAGCISTQPLDTNQATPQTILQSAESIAPSPLPSETFLPTNTPARVTVTPSMTQPVKTTDTPSPTTLPDQLTETIFTCDEEAISPPKDFGVEGVIVYLDQKNRGINSVGGKPLTYSQLPVPENKKYTLFGFSPDGKWLAYSDDVPSYEDEEASFYQATLSLLSFEGQKIEHPLNLRIEELDIPPNPVLDLFSDLNGWRNEKLLQLHLKTYITQVKPGFLDPFEGIWRIDLYQGFSEIELVQGVHFSPDLTRVLSSDGDHVLLRDVTNNNKILARFPGDWINWTYAGWAQDSSWAIYGDQFGTVLYIVSRDGSQIRRVRNLHTSNPAIEILFHQFKWSPNGKYIAMSGTVHDKESHNFEAYYLLVYDVNQEAFVFKCPFEIETDPFFYWSPDSQYVGVTSIHSMELPLMIINVKDGKRYILADQAIAGGWSDKFPVQWPK